MMKEISFFKCVTVVDSSRATSFYRHDLVLWYITARSDNTLKAHFKNNLNKLNKRIISTQTYYKLTDSILAICSVIFFSF